MKQAKAMIDIRENGTNIKWCELEIDDSTTLGDLLECLKEALKLPGNTNNWACFSQENRKFYKDRTEIIGSMGTEQKLIIELFPIEIRTEITLWMQDKILRTYETKIAQTTTIQEILDFQNTLDGIISLVDKNLTCFSMEDQKYFEDKQQMIGKQFLRRHLRIYISEKESRVQNLSNSQDFHFCQTHPSCPIQFICTEKHHCQRRLCAECQFDQIHYSLRNQNYLPLDHFKEKIRQQAYELINRQNNFQILQQYMKKIISKLEELILSQKKIFEDAIYKYNDQFKLGNELLKNLEQQQLLDNRNQVLEEMVSIYQQDLIKNQGFIQNLNFKTKEVNLKKVDDMVGEFEKKLADLKLIVIPVHEWYFLQNKIVKRIMIQQIHQLFTKMSIYPLEFHKINFRYKIDVSRENI